MSKLVVFGNTCMFPAELARSLGKKPTREAFVELYTKLPIKYLVDNRMTVDQLATFFDNLPETCLEWAIAEPADRELVYRAIIRGRRMSEAIRTNVLMKARNDYSILIKCVLGGPYAIPEDIYGEDLLKLLVCLEVIAGGKRFISGIPSEEEIKTRMVELLLKPHPNALEIQDEAIYLAASLKSAIGRGKQARTVRLEKKRKRSLISTKKAA